MKQVAFVLALIISVGSPFFASCSREQKRKEASGGMMEHGMPAQWKLTLPQGDPAQGRRIFVEVECYKCHEIKSETFPAVAFAEKGVGPELSQMAGMHPIEFFAESIIDPNAVIDSDAKEKGYLGGDGKSKMPNYNDVLTIKQVLDLTAYLASLKGQERKAHH